MEIKVLKPEEKSLINDLVKKEYYDITFNVQNYLLDNIRHDIVFGCFDDNLIGCFSVSQLNRVELMIIDKEHSFENILKDFITILKKFCNGSINISIHQKYLKEFCNEGFYIESKNDEYVSLKYENSFNKQFSNFEEVYTFIASQKDRVYSLDNFKRYMHDFGDIQNHLSCVHIGGTNGKGSTTNYVRSVLQLENYKVGTFTSPALYSRLDVIRINNESISEKEYVEYSNRYMDSWLEYQLSMFEIEVFIAIIHFIHHKVDFAIFEVGLGGELDATNIVNPLICAITNIGLDHVEYLGDTYEKIAMTKAGIIKKNSAFVTAETKQTCTDIFRDICYKLNVEYIEVGNIDNITEDLTRISYDYNNYHVMLNTSASYQSRNSALALEILTYLKEKSIIHLSNTTLLQGLKNALWQGRFEIVYRNPLVIIDGAHNKEGIEAFCQSAKKYKNIKIIFSALKDKDTHAMIEKLLSLTQDVTICEFDYYRSQSAELLAEDFPVKIQKQWKKAIDEAFLHDGVTFVTGSLYFITQVRPYILNKQKFD